MAIFAWCNGAVPDNMEIKQVYGIIFSNDGRILLMVEKNNGKIKYCLSGGHPEDVDKGIEVTLRREVLEEVNITITQPILVGYQEVDEEDGSLPFAQVRMAALIDNVGEIRPDIATGKNYERLLVPPMRAVDLLRWGKIGYEQIMAALEVAINVFAIQQFSEKEEYV